MDKEYIERDAAIRAYCENICDFPERCPYPCEPVGAVKRIPAADVAPVVHGRWVEENGYQICSNCGDEHSWDEYRASFCECCGAKMDLEEQKNG